MNNVKKINQHVWISVLVYVFIGVVLVGLRSMNPDSASYPRYLMYGMAFLNTCLLVDGVRRTITPSERKQCVMTWGDVKFSFLTTVFVVLYVIAFQFIGYFPATVAMLVGMMIYFRVRSWKVLLFYTGGFAVFAYVAFVVLLNVNLV